jgi:hypothetical protein
MNVVVYTFALLFVTIDVLSQSQTVSLTFENKTPIGNSKRVHTIGTHPLATIGYDEELGEVEIPPFPLPGGIFYVWSVIRTPDLIWLSPLDLRPFRESMAWIDTFDLRASWSGGTLDVRWSESKPPHIDSVYLVDGFTDFPNNVVKAKLWSDTIFSTTNPAIDRFRCIVWWNATGSSVENSSQLSQKSTIFPNPTRSHITIHSNATTYTVVNVMGQRIVQGALEDGVAIVNTSHLTPGAYIVRLVSSTDVEHRTIIVE